MVKNLWIGKWYVDVDSINTVKSSKLNDSIFSFKWLNSFKQCFTSKGSIKTSPCSVINNTSLLPLATSILNTLLIYNPF